MKIMIITYSVTLFKFSTRDKHASVLFLLHSCIHLTWFLPCYGLKLLAHQQMWLFWGKSGGSIPHLHRDISCRVAFPPLPECHRRWCLTQECDIPTHTHIQTHTHCLPWWGYSFQLRHHTHSSICSVYQLVMNHAQKWRQFPLRLQRRH